MQVFAGLSVGLLILAALVVAFKTFGLWLRTRGLPELLLSLYLCFATIIGYPLAIAMSMIPPSESWQVHVVADSVTALGWSALLLFTLNVFRRDSRWARVLVGVLLCGIAASVGAYAAEVTGPDPRTPEQIPGFTAALMVPAAVVFFWTTLEALGYYRRLKLRLRLGLADNAVANRMLLWGLMALADALALVANMLSLLAGSYMSPAIVLISSVLGLFHASCLFLAFHPPGWYTRMLSASAAAVEV
jgi:hypothetical protein